MVVEVVREAEEVMGLDLASVGVYELVLDVLLLPLQPPPPPPLLSLSYAVSRVLGVRVEVEVVEGEVVVLVVVVVGEVVVVVVQPPLARVSVAV